MHKLAVNTSKELLIAFKLKLIKDILHIVYTHYNINTNNKKKYKIKIKINENH